MHTHFDSWPCVWLFVTYFNFTLLRCDIPQLGFCTLSQLSSLEQFYHDGVTENIQKF